MLENHHISELHHHSQVKKVSHWWWNWPFVLIKSLCLVGISWVEIPNLVPSGYLTYGKSPFLRTVNHLFRLGPFPMANCECHNQRVHPKSPSLGAEIPGFWQALRQSPWCLRVLAELAALGICPWRRREVQIIQPPSKELNMPLHYIMICIYIYIQYIYICIHHINCLNQQKMIHTFIFQSFLARVC